MRRNLLLKAYAIAMLSSQVQAAPVPIPNGAHMGEPAIIKAQDARLCGECRRRCYASYQSRLRLFCRTGSASCAARWVEGLNRCLLTRCGTRPPGACVGF